MSHQTSHNGKVPKSIKLKRMSHNILLSLPETPAAIENPSHRWATVCFPFTQPLYSPTLHSQVHSAGRTPPHPLRMSRIPQRTRLRQPVPNSASTGTSTGTRKSFLSPKILWSPSSPKRNALKATQSVSSL